MADHDRHTTLFSIGGEFHADSALADARFAGDQGKPSPARHRVCQRRTQSAISLAWPTNFVDEVIDVSPRFALCAQPVKRLPATRITNRGFRSVVIQCAPHLPYCGIDGVLGIEKMIFSPDPFVDFVAGKELPGVLDELKEQVQAVRARELQLSPSDVTDRQLGLIQSRRIE